MIIHSVSIQTEFQHICCSSQKKHKDTFKSKNSFPYFSIKTHIITKNSANAIYLGSYTPT